MRRLKLRRIIPASILAALGLLAIGAGTANATTATDEVVDSGNNLNFTLDSAAPVVGPIFAPGGFTLSEGLTGSYQGTAVTGTNQITCFFNGQTDPATGAPLADCTANIVVSGGLNGSFQMTATIVVINEPQTYEGTFVPGSGTGDFASVTSGTAKVDDRAPGDETYKFKLKLGAGALVSASIPSQNSGILGTGSILCSCIDGANGQQAGILGSDGASILEAQGRCRDAADTFNWVVRC